MPAFATSRSTWPISANASATDSRDATSIATARPPVSAATPSIWSRERAETTTDQPSPASERAIEAPIPRPPPVMTATPSGNRGSNRLEGLRVLQRREVAWIGAERRRLHGAADDLRRARPRQRIDEEDAVGLERLAELVRDVVGDLCRGRRRTRKQAAEDP